MYQGLNFHLDKTVEVFRKKVAQFAAKEIAPHATKIDQANTLPKDLWPKMGKLGLLGITVAKEYGGTDLGFLAHALAMEEISRASGAIGLSYGAHSNLCVNQIYQNGSTQQKKRYLPKLISGEHIGALAMSEPNAGSDVMSMQLHAEKKRDRYVLNGKKMWITNGPEANIIVVYAKTNFSTKPHGITAFIIENTFQGFKPANKLDKLGMRGSDTSALIFENCEVPEENILGKLNEGARLLMNGLDYERVILAAGPVGIMQACLDVVLPYVHQRKQFEHPIGEFELIQAKVADMYAALNACRAYLYAVAAACDHGEITRKDAAAVILYNAEKATHIALDAIQCLGGNGYINDYPTGRLLRDAKLYEIGAGTSEIRRILIGKELFKETI